MVSFQVRSCSRLLFLGSIVVLILPVSSAIVSAQAPRPGGAGTANEADAMFRNLDTNRDGKLTLDEAGPNARNLMQHVFEMAGKARGESLTRDEFRTVFDKHKSGAGGNRPNPPPGGRPNPTPGGRPNPTAGGRPEPDAEMNDDADSPAESGLPPLLAQLDGNNDGKLSRSELQRLTQLFERLDTDKDGALSVEEIRSTDRLPKTETKAKSDTRPPSRTGRGTPPKSAEATDGDAESRTTNRPTTGNTTSSRGGNRSSPTGVWRGWVVDGRGENANSGQMEIELTIEGNQITGRELGTRRAPGGLGGGTFVMTGDGRSGNLDAEGNAGPQDGRSFQGIYEFDGEVLRWCVSNRGRQRPTAMATDRGNYLMILRQQR